ncbi:TPA: pyocin knob domain-containing protein [Enterococcus faecalis]
MSYEKQHWQTYDELKTEEENKALGAVVTSERMNHVEDGIAISHENIDSHIKQFDNPHKVTSEQVGAYSKEEANEKFAESGSSYSKKESDDKFKTSDAQPLPKGITSFEQLSDFSGKTFYLTATQAASMSDFNLLPSEYQKNFSFYVENQSAAVGHYRLQTVQPVDIAKPLPAIRLVANGINRTPFKLFAMKDEVVSLTDIENGALVSKKTVIKAQNWNEILDEGIYTVFGASGINRPYDRAVYGVLIVYADNTFVSQTYIYKGETYIRSRQGSPASWTDWNKMTVDNGQFNKFVYKQSGSPDTNVVSQLEVTCIRIGNVVTCHMRVNVTKVDVEPKNNVLLQIPEGFRATYNTGGEDIGAIWNIPFTVNSTAPPSGQKIVKMHLEPGNGLYPNRVTLMSGQTGNQYATCTWTTDDPYPKIGKVGLGTVVKLTAKSDGSFSL